MKKLVLAILMAITLSASVSAFGWMTEYYEIHTEQQMEEEQIVCMDEQVLQEHVAYWNQLEFSTEVINIIGDGKHVIHLTGQPFEDATELTVETWAGKIQSITKGTCVDEDELYREFYTDIDFQEKEQSLFTKYKEGRIDPFDEGYIILRSVDGVTWPEKFKIIKVGLKAIANKWPGETQNEVDT